MTTLTDFLLARITEDEETARAATGAPWAERDVSYEPPHAKGTSNVEGDPWTVASVVNTTDALHIARWDPTRVLAECEAKRRIVEEFAKHDQRNSLEEQAWQAWHLILRTLAKVYSDHPDYDPTWAA